MIGSPYRVGPAIDPPKVCVECGLAISGDQGCSGSGWPPNMQYRHCRSGCAEAVKRHVSDLERERDSARQTLDEREADMHARIRADYDKTVADCWRAKVAEVERERDAARAMLRSTIDVFRIFETASSGPVANRGDVFFRIKQAAEYERERVEKFLGKILGADRGAGT